MLVNSQKFIKFNEQISKIKTISKDSLNFFAFSQIALAFLDAARFCKNLAEVDPVLGAGGEAGVVVVLLDETGFELDGEVDEGVVDGGVLEGLVVGVEVID
jgi:hypothetical protein